MSQRLTSQFQEAPVFVREDGICVRRERLLWWENAPANLPEKKIPEEERWRRRQRWYRKHSGSFAASCAFCWPPMPLEVGKDLPPAR